MQRRRPLLLLLAALALALSAALLLLLLVSTLRVRSPLSTTALRSSAAATATTTTTTSTSTTTTRTPTTTIPAPLKLELGLTSLTRGEDAHVLERVCWSPPDAREDFNDDAGGDVGGGTVTVFTTMPLDEAEARLNQRMCGVEANDVEFTYEFHYMNCRFLKWRVAAAEEWDARAASSEPVVFFQPYKNPFHCLFDYAASFFAVDAHATPVASSFLVAAPRKPTQQRLEKEWCFHLADRLRIWTANARPTSHRCFARLIVPAFARSRFVVDWSAPESAALNTANLDHVSKNPRGFPRSSLVEMRRRVRADIINNNNNNVVVLVLDRSDASRRVWANANEFVALLRKTSPFAKVVYPTAAEWTRYTPADQARAFSESSLIISAEGAQLANVIFAPSTATIIEVGCAYEYVNERRPHVNEDNENDEGAEEHDDWTNVATRNVTGIFFANRASWTPTLATRMGMTWWLFASRFATQTQQQQQQQQTGCTRDVASFRVDAAALVAFATSSDAHKREAEVPAGDERVEGHAALDSAG